MAEMGGKKAVEKRPKVVQITDAPGNPNNGMWKFVRFSTEDATISTPACEQSWVMVAFFAGATLGLILGVAIR